MKALARSRKWPRERASPNRRASVLKDRLSPEELAALTAEDVFDAARRKEALGAYP